MTRVALSLLPSAPGPAAALAAERDPGTVDDALALAHELADLGQVPGDGSTADQWEALATVAAGDLGAVRAIEPHLDAIAILRQAAEGVELGADGDLYRELVGRGGARGLDTPLRGTRPAVAERSGTRPAFGVFAAEGGDDPLLASEDGGGWSLTGTKPWCSLAGRLDAALITASAGDGPRRLFAVELTQPGVTVRAGAWAARGLVEIPSGPVHFERVPAVPVGEPGWYLERPGFAWGGIGVAACWLGGAVGIARTVHEAAASKPNPHLLAHLGAIDELLQSSRRALLEAATLIDHETRSAASASTGTAIGTGTGTGTGSTGLDARLLAKRVRATVARACEEIIDRAGHALGPAPLALDEAHAKRVADLTLYVRQHHAERDQQSLGEALAKETSPW